MPKFNVIVYEETWEQYEIEAEDQEAAEKFMQDSKNWPEPQSEGSNGVTDIMIEEV